MFLDIVFSLLRPSLRNLPKEHLAESETWSDEEIIRITESSPALPGSDGSLVQISEDTVVKLGHIYFLSAAEALALSLVRAQTCIPVPRVQRVIRHIHDEGDSLIVMDLVKNSTQLHVRWPSLSSWKKLKVILTMRWYLGQLRRIRDPHLGTPGPLGASPLPCSGLQFGYDSTAPFPTPAALAEYFHKQLRFAEERASRGYAPAPGCQPLDDALFTPLVFTHNDLNMRNILIDADEQIWIVDFGFSGFYPPWFEYLGMVYAAQKDSAPRDWQQAIKFMAKPSFKVEKWMEKIGYTFNP